ncbi:MAG: SIMPL domain-containing protein, partial [Bacteroidetes bacterium]|nr:SIMPL domain-containing protein [Bacteroidota bacterium]
MKTHFSSIAFALAIILAALSFSNAYKFKYKSNNSVSVTGLGSKDFVSDLIVWSGSFIRKNGSLKDAYAELDSDRDKIKKYLLKQGTSTDEIIFSAVDIDKEFADVWDDSGTKTISVFSGYRLTQRVQIESKDVDKVEAISRQVTELINSGIEFYSSSPEYYYTKLAELKIEMIAEATKDANTRAKKIAENAGSDIGALKNASMGV